MDRESMMIKNLEDIHFFFRNELAKGHVKQGGRVFDTIKQFNALYDDLTRTIQYLRMKNDKDRYDFYPYHIVESPAGKINISVPYNTDFLSKIKEMDGRVWDSESKCWVLDKEQLDEVVEILKDVYKCEDKVIHIDLDA